eukprot:Gb_17901 [translate_table: standard]
MSMGKYMRKGKGIGEVAVMEVSHVGVRTRAALQRARKLHGQAKSSSTAKLKPSCIASMQTSYLELRSRRLEKVAVCCPKVCTVSESNHNNNNINNKNNLGFHEEEAVEKSRLIQSEQLSTRQSFSSQRSPCREASMAVQKLSAGPSRRNMPSTVANSRTDSATFSQSHSRTKSRTRKEDENSMDMGDIVPPSEELQDITNEVSMEMQVSFGENIMDNDPRERRETTPSSNLRGETATLETPGSTTRTVHPRRMQNEGRRTLFEAPTLHEIDEFFAVAEAQEQRRFTERYNYDPVNDVPLPGRYEWVRLRP